MSERLKEPVLKTGDAQASVGSNPTLSATSFIQLQKYPRGRRGSPAKGVGWLKPARGFKSLLLRQVTGNAFCERFRLLFLLFEFQIFDFHILQKILFCAEKNRRELRSSKHGSVQSAFVFLRDQSVHSCMGGSHIRVYVALGGGELRVPHDLLNHRGGDVAQSECRGRRVATGVWL